MGILLRLRGERRISQELKDTTPVASTEAVKAQPQAYYKRLLKRSRLGRTFRFSLQSFRLKGFTSRQFSIVEAAFLLMMALIASRCLGVVRQTIFNALFGVGPEANAYYAAARLPDALFDLIAGGTLSVAFIPVFLSYDRDKGSREAWRLASLIFNVLLVLLAILAIIGEFLAPAFVSDLLVPGYTASQKALTTSLTRIMLWQPLILGLGTIATAILNSKRQFLLPALSIAVYNIGMIAGLLVTLLFPSIGIYGPTYGVLVAAVCQVAVHLPGLSKQKIQYSFEWNLRHPGLREVFFLLAPNSFAVGIGYVGIIIETAYTSYLPDPASLSALHNAHMLQALPVALLSQAVGQAILPHLAAQAAEGRYVRMYQTVLKVMGLSIFLTVPVAIAIAIVGRPAIHILFRHGAFGEHAASLTYLALLGYVIAVPGNAAGDLITRGFYALKDARIPLLLNIFTVIARFGLLVLLFGMFQGSLTILAIPLALAGSATSEAILLMTILLWRLRSKMKDDRSLQRLQRRRAFVTRNQQAGALINS